MQQQTIDPCAYETEHGVQAQCPTPGPSFGVTYLSTIVRVSADGRFVSIACACCDAERHTGDEYDPTIPQWHSYFYRQVQP